MTPHASHLIIGVETEAPEFEVCNVLTAVLVKILILYEVTPYRCECSVRHFEGS